MKNGATFDARLKYLHEFLLILNFYLAMLIFMPDCVSAIITLRYHVFMLLFAGIRCFNTI